MIHTSSFATKGLLERDDSMIDDKVRPAPTLRPGDVRARTTTIAAGPGSRGLFHDLQELRDCVLQRLDSIESLARRRSGGPSVEITRLEETLERKIAELEHERGRLRADVENEESTWRRLLAELESDRQLLAEAWERLERERIDAGGSGHAPAAHAPRTPASSVTHTPPPPTPRVPAGADAVNPVAETILRQFQTLCGDVRRTAHARSSPR
jgi:hypothetical protein